MLQVSDSVRVAGNAFFRHGEHMIALFKYKKSLRYLNKLHESDISNETEQKLLALEIPCLLNWQVYLGASERIGLTQLFSFSAACYLKKKKYDLAIEVLNEALEMAPENAKALFRRGQAFHGKREYEKSVHDLQKALQYAPNDKSIMSELVAVKGEIQAYHSNEKQKFARLFSS